MTGLVRDTGAEGKVSCENHVIHALGGATWSYLGIYINLPIVGSAYSVVLIEVGDGASMASTRSKKPLSSPNCRFNSLRSSLVPETFTWIPYVPGKVSKSADVIQVTLTPLSSSPLPVRFPALGVGSHISTSDTSFPLPRLSI
eukprot:scaffold426_cov319-Pavlova_lutheri.AAC.3